MMNVQLVSAWERGVLSTWVSSELAQQERCWMMVLTVHALRMPAALQFPMPRQGQKDFHFSVK